MSGVALTIKCLDLREISGGGRSTLRRSTLNAPLLNAPLLNAPLLNAPLLNAPLLNAPLIHHIHIFHDCEQQADILIKLPDLFKTGIGVQDGGL